MKYWYAFRNGWAGSNIYICELDENFKPTEKWAKLDLGKKGSRVGREDPRLFRLNGKLHLSYTGYEGRRTNVLFARIDEKTLKVEDVFFPQIPGRAKWEKNFAFFDYQGIAHAVYSINPHKILRIEGNSAEWAYETPFNGTWSGGYMRGGASPVLHNGEWYHFFHGATYVNGKRRYNTGVYTFRTEPPFDILRYTPDPIDEADIQQEHTNYCHVLFCGGVLYRDGQWITANGIHDRWSELRFYDAEMIEKLLIPITRKPFAIISNDCWGTIHYQALNKEYSSPFVNLFMAPECYLKVLSNLNWYLQQPLTFIQQSKHQYINDLRAKHSNNYPIGMIGDVELQFLHYTESEALANWTKRAKRLLESDAELFYKFSDNGGCTQEQLEAFDAMPFKDKVCFTSKHYPHLKSAVHIPCDGDEVPLPMQTDNKFFDVKKWLRLD